MCYMDYQNLRMWNANCWKWSYKANSVLQYFSLNNFCIVTLLQYECLIVFMVVHFVVLSLLCQCICIFSPKATKVRLNYVLFVSIIKVSGDSVRHTVVCFQSAPQMNEMSGPYVCHEAGFEIVWCSQTDAAFITQYIHCPQSQWRHPTVFIINKGGFTFTFSQLKVSEGLMTVTFKDQVKKMYGINLMMNF